MPAVPTGLRSARLLLRRWTPQDRAPFAAINADPVVMEYYASTLSRSESDAFVERIEDHFESDGFGLWAVEVRETGAFTGYVGLWPATFEAHFTPAVEVGWRLNADVWGHGYATEAARVALNDGFRRIGLDEIVSFTSTINRRSRSVMEKLDMQRNGTDDFDHPSVTAPSPLRPHVLYRLTARRVGSRQRAGAGLVASSHMTFQGFPPEAIEFYEQLGADNSKTFWADNKDRFVEQVKTPMTQLIEVLDDYGPFHMFRPHNDLRFHKNKPPYKTHQGAYGESEGGTGHYMHLSAEGLMVAAGYYAMAKDQLKRFREAVVAEHTGEEIATLVAVATKLGYEIGAIDELKTAPRGYDRDHPRIGLIRRKGLMLSKDFGAPKWLDTRQVEKKIRDCWDGTADVCAWLDAHVGPSTEPPGDRPF